MPTLLTQKDLKHKKLNRAIWVKLSKVTNPVMAESYF